MGQFGFFDADRRLAAITAKGDPLEMIARVVPFESFRAEIEAAVLTPVSEKKSSAGRKPIAAQHGRGRFIRPKRASSANMIRSRRPRRAADRRARVTARGKRFF
jgi:hypothetical protein